MFGGNEVGSGIVTNWAEFHTDVSSFMGSSQWTTMVVEFFVWKELQNKKMIAKKVNGCRESVAYYSCIQ